MLLFVLAILHNTCEQIGASVAFSVLLKLVDI